MQLEILDAAASFTEDNSNLNQPDFVLCLRLLPANLHAEILDLRGFDSSRILILRGGILASVGNFPEICEANLNMFVTLPFDSSRI